MKRKSVINLSQREKLLYLEVEQLRARLYLDDSSLLFQFLAAFYFTARDMRLFFTRGKRVQFSPETIKKKSIATLKKRRRFLLFLNNSPYGWILFFIRMMRLPSIKLIARNSTPPQKTKQSVLVFGSTGIDDLQSRSVQIACKLAEKRKVIYIEGIFDEGRKSSFRIVKNKGNLAVVRLTAQTVFHINYQKPSRKSSSLLHSSFKKLLQSFHSQPFKLYIHHPFWHIIIPFRKKSFIFDRAVDYMHGNNSASSIMKADRILTNKALRISASLPQFFQGKDGMIVKNGVEWNLFKETSKMIQTCDVGLCWIKKPVIGYMGISDELIDEVLVGKIASAFPNASVVLVGNTDYRPIIEVAEHYPNIFPVGKQPYKKLPLFLQSFDILIAPYKRMPHVIVDHPELPLYLSSGKPIIMTAADGRRNQKKYIYQPKTHVEWTDMIDEALHEKKRSKKKYLRIAAAKKLGWKIPKL